MVEKHNSRILIVDDDPDLREVMAAKLEAVGFSIFTARDGTEGIVKAQTVNPDLILLDIQMPNMDGFKTLNEMRKDPKLEKVKVLFLTNLGEPYNNVTNIDDAVAKEMGALGYIRKGEDLDKIVEEVNSVLAGK
jgi:two-component system alkaline phosphatase synthesis response regulator PhoP